MTTGQRQRKNSAYTQSPSRQRVLLIDGGKESFRAFLFISGIEGLEMKVHSACFGGEIKFKGFCE